MAARTGCGQNLDVSCSFLIQPPTLSTVLSLTISEHIPDALTPQALFLFQAEEPYRILVCIIII